MPKLKEGDLVRVSYLPKSMRHFSVKLGVVYNINSNGNFFIFPITKNGTLQPQGGSGWYDTSNVTQVLSHYAELTTDGWEVCTEIDSAMLSVIRSQLIKVDTYSKEVYSKHMQDISGVLLSWDEVRKNA